jgi:hypothetical protein
MESMMVGYCCCTGHVIVSWLICFMINKKKASSNAVDKVKIDGMEDEEETDLTIFTLD